MDGGSSQYQGSFTGSTVPPDGLPLPHGAVSESDARSMVSGSTYYTAQSSHGATSIGTIRGQLRNGDDYAQLLRSENIWPVPPELEQDWSGRGQHLRFEKGDASAINDMLHVQATLGHTRTALVQSVKCRRILLARKTITCGKRTMTKENAIKEVAHLSRLHHAHIVRVIGTYVKGPELSILLYPAAEYNLEEFLDHIRSTVPGSAAWVMREAGRRFYGCISSAVAHIHSKLTKHMDIKPQNILIKTLQDYPYYHALVADFGIARAYQSSEDIETDGRMAFTRRYAAPEVVRQDVRGLPADIFSLGCVFLEMFSALLPLAIRDGVESELLRVFDTNENGDRSYSANAERLQHVLVTQFGWTSIIDSPSTVHFTISSMLNVLPQNRPTAQLISSHFGTHRCCSGGPLPLEAIQKQPPDGED